MDFKLTRACDDCPFRKVGGIRLRKQRAREIARSQVDAQGGTFPCHKTVDYENGSTAKEQYCAGAIAFALNVGMVNQFLRIMGRLGAWTPAAIRDRGECFGSVREMVAAQSGGVQAATSLTAATPDGQTKSI